MPSLRVAVFGLGYVGCVTAACLASEGHRVVGVDVNPAKVERLNRGLPTVDEPGLAPRVRRAVRKGLLRATEDGPEAARVSALSLICVGTPGRPDGRPDLRAVESTCRAIGWSIRIHPGWPVVVVRSTVSPGTTRKRILPILARTSRRKPGAGFDVAVNPEFMREGSSLWDYYHPSRVVIGAERPATANRVRALYRRVRAPVVVTDLDTAEMVKYVDNAFHGIKVAFANEVGALARSIGVDGRRVMEIFCMDRKLNLSPYYLRPGMPYGGSCIPKDTRALARLARDSGVAMPLIEASLDSNQKHKERLVELIAGLGKQPVGLLGLTFKAGTDDFRESAALDVARELLRRGISLRIFDPSLEGEVIGKNLQFLEETMPEYRALLARREEVLRACPVVVLLSEDPRLRSAVRRLPGDRVLVDASGLSVGFGVR